MTKIVATVDLGSNSFHMLITEVKDNGEITTLSRQKQKIQLRAGLNEDLTIDEETQQRAIRCLESFAEEIKQYNVEHIKAVGTYTLRKAKNKIKPFKKKLEKALGAKIKIISGPEEARLVYVGAKGDHSNKNKALIIDIGGGSTEFVIGRGDKIIISKSLDIGCVGIQKEFFSDERLNFTNFNNAVNKIRKVISPIIKKYKSISWDIVLGSSGTIQSAIKLANSLSENGALDIDFLDNLINEMIKRKKVENINFKGLREDRVNVIAGGMAILYAIFDSLDIDEMFQSKGAVREGILYELVKSKYKIVMN